MIIQLGNLIAWPRLKSGSVLRFTAHSHIEPSPHLMSGAVAGQTDASVFAPVDGQIYAAPAASQMVCVLN